jgi:hypothetical protein
MNRCGFRSVCEDTEPYSNMGLDAITVTVENETPIPIYARTFRTLSILQTKRCTQ